MDLQELRKEIDKIDDELIPLLMKRMDISEQVAKYKVQRGLPVLNAEREQQILDDVAEKCGDRGDTIVFRNNGRFKSASAQDNERRRNASPEYK